MKHIIPAANWPTALANAIDNANDGDTIICRSANMKTLGESTHTRMCPDKTIVFEVEDVTKP